jgi:hypothetical protein
MGKVLDAETQTHFRWWIVRRRFAPRCLPTPHAITLRLEIRRAHVLRVESRGTGLIWGSLCGRLGHTVGAHEMSCSASPATHRV